MKEWNILKFSWKLNTKGNQDGDQEEISRQWCRQSISRKTQWHQEAWSMVAYCRFAHYPKLYIQRNSVKWTQAPSWLETEYSEFRGREDRGGSLVHITLALLILPIALWESQLLTNDWGQWIFPARLYSNVHSIKENKNLGKFGCFEPPGNPSCYVFLTKRWQGLLGTELLLEGGGKIITSLVFIADLNMCHSRLKNGGLHVKILKLVLCQQISV